MAKKKIEQPALPMRDRLTKDEFIEWKTYINDMLSANDKAKIVELEQKILAKDAEIATLKSELFIHKQVIPKKKNIEQTKKAYTLAKEKIENRLGYSLNDKTINEFTLEVIEFKK